MNGLFLVVGDDDQRPEEVVPSPHETEDGDRSDDRLAHLPDDLPEDVEFFCPIDAGCLNERVGKCDQILTGKENSRRGGSRWDDDAPKAVEHPQMFELQEDGDHDDLQRDHEGGDHKGENQIPAREDVLCQGISCHDVDYHRKQGGDHRYKHCIRKVSGEVSLLYAGYIVFNRPVLWEKCQGYPKQFTLWLERREEYPEDGEQGTEG